MRLLLLIACFWAAALSAAPKVIGYVRVTESTPIYHGNSAASKVEGTASKGEVYELLDIKENSGFYKIAFEGHVSYIGAEAVLLLQVSGTPMPTPKPTLAPTTAPTLKPTTAPTLKPTLRPTLAPSPEAEATLRPTDAPTFKPTVRPTPRPTEEPTAEPTARRTPGSTYAPTEEPTEAPTARPTLRPTLVPTQEPTEAPTLKPTLRPTLAPTDVPTQRPTAVPTAYPTQRPTLAPTPQPGTITPATAKGRRRVPPRTTTRTTTQRRRSGGGYGSAIAFGSNVAGSMQLNRQPGHLDAFELVLPIGAGKHEALVQPPYKQHPGAFDQRPIDMSGFVGLGLELRLARPVRWHFDWLAHTHRTKAAELGSPATKVNVPGVPSTTVFDESEAWYRMNSHQLRTGLKLSLPHPVIEPWINGTYGVWIWTAELSDVHREIIYGDETGVDFGGTLGVGIDFHGSFGGGLGWTITPFVEWGAPTVYPKFKDIAGLGVDWKDNFGTPVAVPARAGIQFGIGY